MDAALKLQFLKQLLYLIARGGRQYLHKFLQLAPLSLVILNVLEE
jgi:hypothetical protein